MRIIDQVSALHKVSFKQEPTTLSVVLTTIVVLLPRRNRLGVLTWRTQV